MIEMSVNIHNCCVSVSRGLASAASIQWATAKGLAECQAVLDRHQIVKHWIHCAGEIVETPCKILANVKSNRYLIHFKFFLMLYSRS
jgi:galactokinase